MRRDFQGLEKPFWALVCVFLLSTAVLSQINGRFLRSKQVKQTENPLPASTIVSQDAEKQKLLADSEAVKIIIGRDGWYRVEVEELSGVGFDSTSNQSQIQLFNDGIEQAIKVNPNGAIEFFGKTVETEWTKEKTYWLVKGQTAGKRITTTAGGNFDQTAETSVFENLVRKEDKNLRTTVIINATHDGFFAGIINNVPLKQSLWLENVSSSQTVLEVAVQGLTMVNPHVVKVILNGTEIGTLNVRFRERRVENFTINSTLLRPGKNVVQFVSSGSADVSVLEYIKAKFEKETVAVENFLHFKLAGGEKTLVKGFNVSDVLAFDLSDLNNVKEIAVSPQTFGIDKYALTISSTKDERTVWIQENKRLKPVAVKRNNPQSLSGRTNQADFVIISHQNFIAALEPLQRKRRSEGLRTKIVDVEDIYDEFSFGEKTPLAIKEFIKTAKDNWRTSPSYVLLVGDANSDVKKYLPEASEDFVPSFNMVGLFGESVSDDWFADFDNDAIADIPVGRFSVRNEVETQNIVNKVLQYENLPENTTRSRGALMVSDAYITYDFQLLSNDVRQSLPNEMPIVNINRTEGTAEEVRSRVLSGINNGYGVVNFLGHGSYGVWTSAQLLRTNDAFNLTNGTNTSIFVMLTCLNGGFPDVNESLAEALHKTPTGGAVAVWASSGQTYAFGQVPMSKAFYQKIFSEPQIRLGDAVKHAKTAMADMDIRRFSILFADPTMKVKTGEM